MQTKFRLLNLSNFYIDALPSAIYTFPALWFVLTAAGLFWLQLPTWQAVLAGLVATLLHFDSELWHQLGHAFIAYLNGYPMEGICFIGPLAQSRYPQDEPELPARIHIRRALGGPAASLSQGIFWAAIAYALYFGFPPAVFWVAAFVAFENIFIFGLGAFLPLGFTDGNTLLEWWPQRD